MHSPFRSRMHFLHGPIRNEVEGGNDCDTQRLRDLMEQRSLDVQKIVDIVKRRKRVFGLAFAGIVGVSALVALLWPPTYRSTATILIQEQAVPTDLVRSAISSYVDQQIEKIKQQVMTRSTLLRIVEQFDLYASLRQRSPNEVVLKEFGDDIQIDVISADVVDRRTGQPTKATIAFMLAYDGETPAKAQKVATELTNLFLAENLKARERQAQETTEFLKQEGDNLAKVIEDFEHRIADFKQGAGRALPELFEINLQMMNQSERELLDVTQRLIALEDRKVDLESQLAIIKPNTPIITSTGERILDSEERLKALKAQYVSSAALLSPAHPDIVKMKQEIYALQGATGILTGVEELRKRLADEHAKTHALLETYGDTHPDVIRSRQVIASLEKEILKVAGQPRPQVPAENPENPAYIQVQGQLNSTINQMKALRASAQTLREKVKDFADRLERTAELEPGYQNLIRNRDNSTQKYHEIRFKLLEAGVSQELEEQQKGERFSLIDPPDFPEQPEAPNRLMIMILGVFLAFLGGGGTMALAENLDQSIRSVQDLKGLTQMAPLAIIPYLPVDEEITAMVKRRHMMKWVGAATLLFLVFLGHWLWLPVDVVWYAALRKLGMG